MGNDDAIPDGMQRLLGLFAGDLAKVRFGDLDGPVLEASAGAVRAAARELAEAEALAEAARGSLEAAREALVQKGQRALAYARIFAEGAPELIAKLEGIVLGADMRRAEPRLLTPDLTEAPPRRRGRPPKPPAPASGTLALGGAASHKGNGAAPPPTEDPAEPEAAATLR
jgi:hypothetical protein